MFGVAFLYAGGSWFLFIMEPDPCGWGWTRGLSRFPGQGILSLCSGGWSPSLWSTMKYPVVGWVSMGLAWLWEACLLMLRAVFLLCWRIIVIMSCTGTCWLLGGAWFQCRYRDFWVSSFLLIRTWNQEFFDVELCFLTCHLYYS